ncbi:MAG TPA: hypothetical protein VF897_22615, partial [Roseiflexaceae bacterium]
SLTLFALFLATGLLTFSYAWLTLHRHHAVELSTTAGPQQSHNEIEQWLRHGYFASHGLLVPTQQKVIYRSSTGGYMISGFLAEKLWIGLTGKYSWRLLALHNEVVALLTATLLALLASRVAGRFGAEPLHAFALGVAAQAVQFTFPDNLALYWEMTAQAYALPAALAFLLLEERALDGRRTRLISALQALSIFALTYFEYICGTMFLAAYVITLLLLRDERPPLKRLAAVLLVPWAAALAIYAIKLSAARHELGAKLAGSSFLYRSGLDGDAALYGDHLDIAYGRDIVRAHRPGNHQYLFRWTWLFLAGAAAALATLAAYVRGRAPRIAVVALVALIGTYLLYAAVFSQAVAMHPYLYDALLATPLILALFAFVPALLESLTQRSGVFVLVALLGAIWLAMFQLRLYALCYPLI